MLLCVQVAEGWGRCLEGVFTSEADNTGHFRELGYTGMAQGLQKGFPGIFESALGAGVENSLTPACLFPRAF